MASPREPRGRGRKPAPKKQSTRAQSTGKRPTGKPSSRSRSARPAPERDDRAGPKKWGSVARRGAGRLNDDRPSGASAAFREAAGLEDRERQTETWVRVDDDIRAEASGAIARGKTTK